MFLLLMNIILLFFFFMVILLYKYDLMILKGIFLCFIFCKKLVVFFFLGYLKLKFLKNLSMWFLGFWYMICFFDNSIMLLKSLNVLGVGWSSEMIMVVLLSWMICCSYFIIWKVVELLSLVDILFMNSVLVGLMIILSVVMCFFWFFEMFFIMLFLIMVFL